MRMYETKVFDVKNKIMAKASIELNTQSFPYTRRLMGFVFELIIHGLNMDK